MNKAERPRVLPNNTTMVPMGCGHVYITVTQYEGKPFAQGVGFHGNCPAQIIFEATEDYAVGDFRIERLLPADKDAELDKIIMPFEGRIE